MAFTNFDTKEINCKVIYFGPEGSGKTSTLQSILKNTSEEIKTGLFEFNKQQSDKRYFEFLPVSLGHVKEFHLKLHLFTLPRPGLYETVNSVILKGVDGFVFVADSSVDRMVDNMECYNTMKQLLIDEGYNFADMPRVIQYNKRDLSDLIPINILQAELNGQKFPDQESVAIQSLGTMEALQLMAKQVIKKLAS
jgi:signal recognition particle receptor subunit beta